MIGVCSDKQITIMDPFLIELNILCSRQTLINYTNISNGSCSKY